MLSPVACRPPLASRAVPGTRTTVVSPANIRCRRHLGISKMRRLESARRTRSADRFAGVVRACARWPIRMSGLCVGCRLAEVSPRRPAFWVRALPSIRRLVIFGCGVTACLALSNQLRFRALNCGWQADNRSCRPEEWLRTFFYGLGEKSHGARERGGCRNWQSAKGGSLPAWR
jgi:hypothetical protein